MQRDSVISVLLRLELQRHSVHAVSLPRLRRAIVEDVAEVAAALPAMDFRARHEVALVGTGADGVRHRAIEARPAGAALELRAGLEQRRAAAGAVIGAVALFLVQRTRAAHFGPVA